MMVSLLSSSSNWPRNSPHGSEQQVDYRVRVHVEHACNEGVQALAIELRSGVTGSKGRHEDVSAGEFSHVLLDGVVHVDHLVAHGEDAVVVAFAVQEDPEESLLGGGHMRLVRVFSPTFHQKLLAISLSNVRRSSLRWIWEGSSATPSTLKSSSRYWIWRAGSRSTSGGGQPLASRFTLIHLLM